MSVCLSCPSGPEEPRVPPGPCLWSCKRSCSGRLAGLQGDPQPLHLQGLQSERGEPAGGAIAALRRLRRALVSTSLTLQFDNFARRGLLWGSLLHGPAADGVSQPGVTSCIGAVGFPAALGWQGVPRVTWLLSQLLQVRSSHGLAHQEWLRPCSAQTKGKAGSWQS